MFNRVLKQRAPLDRYATRLVVKSDIFTGQHLVRVAVANLSESTFNRTAMRRLDGHVHVWAPADQADKFPFAGQLLGSTSAKEPPMPGHAEVLLEAMQAAGVSGALIVQPGNHMYDHSYVTSVLQRHPNKFVGCLLADPRPDGGGARELRRLVSDEGYRAVRFNPYLWPEGERMDNEVGRAMYQAAGDLGCPVGHMPFKGLLGQIDAIESLCSEFPSTKVIIDHMGFCNCKDLGSKEWQRLLGLARFPQVYVKTSAFFRVSDDPPPYGDAAAAVRTLVDTFGAERCMWGTDFPWVTEKCGYQATWSLLEDWGQRNGSPVLTEDEADWLMGGTLAALFPGTWT